MTTSPRRILSTISLIVLATTGILAQSGQKIARIEAEGLQTMTTETVIATSGLKIGEPFSPELTDASAERLVNSGLFKKVRKEVGQGLEGSPNGLRKAWAHSGTDESPNRQTLIVNLTIELKN